MKTKTITAEIAKELVMVSVDLENTKTGLEKIADCSTQIGVNTQKIIDLCDQFQID